ncbi:MAG: LysM peptidoglycan-binding domain-containing protein [Planctomycetota bacterium]
MRIAWKTALGLVLAAAAAGGCDQSLSEENAFLREENEALRRQLAVQAQQSRNEAALPTVQAPLGTAAPDEPVAARTYIVKSGDTLSGISRAMYGTTIHWQFIYEANRDIIGPDSNRLQVGMKLRIPPAPSGGGS